MKLRYKITNSILAVLGVAIFALAVTVSYTTECSPLMSCSLMLPTSKFFSNVRSVSRTT